MKKESRSFEDAREFVRSLKLKNQKDWEIYRKSENKPDDIPTTPAITYKNKGWINLGDWLGTGTIAPQKRKYRSFNDARKFVQSLQLKNDREWREFYMSDARPFDIPTAPNVRYKTEWKGLGDWLGTGTISPKEKSKKYLSFQKARAFVRSLEFKNKQEWADYSKSSKKLETLPTAPWEHYKNTGWISMDDFLGHGRISNSSKKFLSFEESRSFVRSLGLSGENEWELYCKSGKRPDNIPFHPERSYKNTGWISFGDFFGTGNVYRKQFKSFEDARSFVRKLRLKNDAQWRIFSTSKKKPDDIPANPKHTYKKEWSGLGDWLGTGTIATQARKYISYQEAKKYVRSLGLKNREDWYDAVKTGKIPKNIPNNPWHVYSKKRKK